MTPDRAAQILQQFNVWRRSNDVGSPPHSGRDIGIAIDVAVRVLSSCADPVTELVRDDLLGRSNCGIKKYGNTLARGDIDLRGWLTHAYEESLDLAQYLRRSMLELDAANKGAPSC